MKNEEKINKAVEMYKSTKYSINHVACVCDITASSLKHNLEKLGVKLRPEEKTKRIDQVLKEVTKDNIDEIHEKYGVDKYILEKAMMLNPTALKQLQIDLAIKEYIETSKFNRSIGALSIKYDINRKTLTKYLKDKNIEITSATNSKYVEEHIFDIIDTEEKAYWLGFFFADGYIESAGNGIGINISLKDKEHLEKFNKFMKYEGGLNISTSHQFGSKDIHNSKGEVIYIISTVIHNDNLWNALNNKGCVPNKSLILDFPDVTIFNNDTKLILAFIRGYFDGDGTLGKYQHSKTNPNMEESLMFIGTLPFLKGVEKYLGEGFIMHKTNCSEQTYRLGYSTAKARKAAELMYKNSTIHLDRKYNIYINDFAAVKSGKNGEA